MFVGSRGMHVGGEVKGGERRGREGEETVMQLKGMHFEVKQCIFCTQTQRRAFMKGKDEGVDEKIKGKERLECKPR